MSRLYTRTGDDGTTALFDGTRVPKDHPRVIAYGSVDETNASLGTVVSAIGLMLGGAGGSPAGSNAVSALRQLAERLGCVQHELFEVGSDLATPLASGQRARVPAVTDEQVRRLETWIDEAVAAAPPLRKFVLPGGSEISARLHVARTVARRAEREVISLSRMEPVGAAVVPYLNRLNDLLFAWSRSANHALGVADVEWTPPVKS